MVVHCSCGAAAVLRTSWTNLNPGRRFWSCNQCGFDSPWLRWFDPVMYKRSKEVIPGLLRKIRLLEAALKQKDKTIARLRWYLLGSWIGVAVILSRVILH